MYYCRVLCVVAVVCVSSFGCAQGAVLLSRPGERPEVHLAETRENILRMCEKEQVEEIKKQNRLSEKEKLRLTRGILSSRVQSKHYKSPKARRKHLYTRPSDKKKPKKDFKEWKKSSLKHLSSEVIKYDPHAKNDTIKVDYDYTEARFSNWNRTGKQRKVTKTKTTAITSKEAYDDLMRKVPSDEDDDDDDDDDDADDADDEDDDDDTDSDKDSDSDSDSDSDYENMSDSDDYLSDDTDEYGMKSVESSASLKKDNKKQARKETEKAEKLKGKNKIKTKKTKHVDARTDEYGMKSVESSASLKEKIKNRPQNKIAEKSKVKTKFKKTKHSDGVDNGDDKENIAPGTSVRDAHVIKSVKDATKQFKEQISNAEQITKAEMVETVAKPTKTFGTTQFESTVKYEPTNILKTRVENTAVTKLKQGGKTTKRLPGKTFPPRRTKPPQLEHSRHCSTNEEIPSLDPVVSDFGMSSSASIVKISQIPRDTEHSRLHIEDNACSDCNRKVNYYYRDISPISRGKYPQTTIKPFSSNKSELLIGRHSKLDAPTSGSVFTGSSENAKSRVERKRPAGGRLPRECARDDHQFSKHSLHYDYPSGQQFSSGSRPKYPQKIFDPFSRNRSEILINQFSESDASVSKPSTSRKQDRSGWKAATSDDDSLAEWRRLFRPNTSPKKPRRTRKPSSSTHKYTVHYDTSELSSISRGRYPKTIHDPFTSMDESKGGLYQLYNPKTSIYITSISDSDLTGSQSISRSKRNIISNVTSKSVKPRSTTREPPPAKSSRPPKLDRKNLSTKVNFTSRKSMSISREKSMNLIPKNNSSKKTKHKYDKFESISSSALHDSDEYLDDSVLKTYEHESDLEDDDDDDDYGDQNESYSDDNSTISAAVSGQNASVYDFEYSDLERQAKEYVPKREKRKGRGKNKKAKEKHIETKTTMQTKIRDKKLAQMERFRELGLKKPPDEGRLNTEEIVGLRAKMQREQMRKWTSDKRGKGKEDKGRETNKDRNRDNRKDRGRYESRKSDRSERDRTRRNRDRSRSFRDDDRRDESYRRDYRRNRYEASDRKRSRAGRGDGRGWRRDRYDDDRRRDRYDDNRRRDRYDDNRRRDRYDDNRRRDRYDDNRRRDRYDDNRRRDRYDDNRRRDRYDDDRRRDRDDDRWGNRRAGRRGGRYEYKGRRGAGNVYSRMERNERRVRKYGRDVEGGRRRERLDYNARYKKEERSDKKEWKPKKFTKADELRVKDYLEERRKKGSVPRSKQVSTKSKDKTLKKKKKLPKKIKEKNRKNKGKRKLEKKELAKKESEKKGNPINKNKIVNKKTEIKS